MTVPVRYYCPRCRTVVTLQRDAYLADKSVTPYPLAGWAYVGVGGDYDAADGVRIVCGEDGTDWDVGAGEGDAAASFDGPGCGEPYYLNFVRFVAGREVEPEPEPAVVELADPHRPSRPRWPDVGPRGPGR